MHGIRPPFHLTNDVGPEKEEKKRKKKKEKRKKTV
jgi:hypothetical protein